MRPVVLLTCCLCLALTVGCRRKERGGEGAERVDPTEDETAVRRPQDQLYVDFNKNWRALIARAPELALPVVRPEKPREDLVTPRARPECVFSADAGRMVAQVTITWSDPIVGGPRIEAAAVNQAQLAAPPLRFDLTLRHDGFEKNLYSTALAAEKQQRFKLPPDSALLNDEPAVQRLGPGLFPKLVDHNIQLTVDRDTASRAQLHTLVLRDLKGGMTYTIRLDRPAKNAWNEERLFSFTTPACPD